MTPFPPWLVSVLLCCGVVQTEPTDRHKLHTLSVAADPEARLPGYVFRPGPGSDAPAWLALGVEQRLRYEERRGPLRETSTATELGLGLSRSRLFLGVEPVERPVRFAIEVQDARQFATDLPPIPANVNHLDVLQLRAEIDLGRWLKKPVRLEIGRSSFDALDRRLLARNRFRNTTSAFDGVKVGIGNQTGLLSAELLALFPTRREPQALDPLDDESRLLGALGKVSTASTVVEPYYLYYRSGDALESSLHTAGVHAFGRLGDSRLDHDLHLSMQAGTVAEMPHRAFAAHAELGRSFRGGLPSRAALWVNYASGDRDPTDSRSQRFDPLFGASHAMYGFTGLFTWQNVVNPAAYVSLRTSRSVRVEGFYRLYWLASSRDALVRIGASDPIGESGSFVGQEVDVAVRWSPLRFTELEIQYGELLPGRFLDRTGRGGARVFFVSLVVGTPAR